MRLNEKEMGIFKIHNFPNFRQTDRFDCGPTCLKIVSKFYGRNFSLEYLKEVCGITTNGTTVKSLIAGAEKIGFQTATALINYETIEKKAPLPCIAYWRNRHYIIVYNINKRGVYVSDPSFGLIKYNKEEFLKAWQSNPNANDDTQGLVMLLEPTPVFFPKF